MPRHSKVKQVAKAILQKTEISKEDENTAKLYLLAMWSSISQQRLEYASVISWLSVCSVEQAETYVRRFRSAFPDYENELLEGVKKLRKELDDKHIRSREVTISE